MSSRRFQPVETGPSTKDRAVLVGVDLGDASWPLEESLAELERLAHTAGAEIVGVVTQRLDRLNPRTFIGAGKAQEVADLVTAREANIVIFDDDLSPSQQANIEDLIAGIRILDRTALILDIFALHAVSGEGKLQVELAQMQYLLPRLRGMWRHLEQAAAASGGKRGIGTRGPGETQLETDRRLARRRIQDLKRELKNVSDSRTTMRGRRAASGVFRVALVGYTNSGKSTLLNRLTDAGVLAYDQLFATLDSTTRRLTLPQGREITLTDTVGFIHKLPHTLVEAFKSTLDEVREADLLLLVTDVSHPEHASQARAVAEVLAEIGAERTTAVKVYNKCDAAESGQVQRLRRREASAVFVSAKTGDGTDELLDRIATEAARNTVDLTVLIPYDRGELVQLAHERAQVLDERHGADGTTLMIRVPSALSSRFEEHRLPPEVGPAATDSATADVSTSDSGTTDSGTSED